MMPELTMKRLIGLKEIRLKKNHAILPYLNYCFFNVEINHLYKKVNISLKHGYPFI